MIDKFVSAVLNKENLDKYLLAMYVILYSNVFDTKQMILFDTIDFNTLMDCIQSFRHIQKNLLSLTLYHKHMFEFLLNHWTRFDGSIVDTLVLEKNYEYFDKIPLNIIKNGTTPLDRCPSLKSLTNKLVVSADTMKLIGVSTDSEVEIKLDNLVKKSRKSYDFLTLIKLSKDLDIDIEEEYKNIRNASFERCEIFFANYKIQKFKDMARQDKAIVEKLYSLLRQSVSWSRLKLKDYYKNMKQYKIYNVAKIVHKMNKSINDYEKQLDILNLSFVAK